MKKFLAVILLIATLISLPAIAHSDELTEKYQSIAQTVFYQNDSTSLSFYYTICTCDRKGANKIAEIGLLIDDILIKQNWKPGYNGSIAYKAYYDIDIFHTVKGMVIYISHNGLGKWFKDFYLDDDSRAIALNIIQQVLSENL